ncbi:unnamed protein product, partial [Symbiodinium sp. CCMP2456]
DPDWEAIACQDDSYVTGVAIGFDEPETADQLERKFKEEEALGRMAPSTHPVLEQKYGKDRVRIASLGDVTAAHRLFLVREMDWPLLCCKVDNSSPVVWYNRVGTFGISSSAFLWSRLFGIIGRCAARFLLTLWFYHLVFVDDVHANFAGKDKFHHLLMWLACFEMFGTPFAYKKFRGGLTSAFVGYELSYPDQRVGISESRGQWLLKWTVKREGVAFRTDAKCSDGFVVLGGWECSGSTQESKWFSLRLTSAEAPYLFNAEGQSQWASASAELLATLAALHVFGHLEAGPARRVITVELLAQTDNKSNEGLARRGSTTKWPLLMLNMQLSHLLMKSSLRLNLGWRPRDQNQEADALTNEAEAVRDTVVGKPRFKGKRKRDKSPW